MIADYKFKNIALYDLARTHTSYANENKLGKNKSNQRLEFLGDSVLSIIVSEYIYDNYPHLPEGSLTKLRAEVVCEKSLHEIAVRLDLGKILLLGRGEAATGGRERVSILADAVEAMLGAVYIDSDMNGAKEFLLPLLEHKIKSTADKVGKKDYKTTLQEIVQRQAGRIIKYVITNESGPDHERTYTVEARVDRRVVGVGKGRSKKDAEQMAAKQAIEKGIR